MNYYPHHIGDFIRDTSRMTDAQCMAYLRMLWLYYETEQPLESDMDALAFRIGALASDVRQILKMYFFEHEGAWHNSRCDKEILAFREKSDKAKKSADARWKNANAMRTHTERNASARVFDANQEPVTSNQNTEANASVARATRKCPDSFEVTPELQAWASEKAMGVDVERETEKMRDYTFTRAIKDWDGAWRNWMRKAAERISQRGGAPPAQSFRELDTRRAAERVAEFAPGIARHIPGDAKPLTTFDLEFPDVLAIGRS